jgi:hypothetical protein
VVCMCGVYVWCVCVVCMCGVYVRCVCVVHIRVSRRGVYSCKYVCMCYIVSKIAYLKLV